MKVINICVTTSLSLNTWSSTSQGLSLQPLGFKPKANSTDQKEERNMIFMSTLHWYVTKLNQMLAS